MSTDTSPRTQHPAQVQPPGTRHRVFLWIFLAIQVIFLTWVISAGVAAPHGGVGLQVGLWVVTDLITGAIYGICQLPRTPRWPSPPVRRHPDGRTR